MNSVAMWSMEDNILHKKPWSRLVIILAIAVAAIGMQVHLLNPALADGTCGPNQRYNDYRSEGCAYNTVQPYTVSQDGFVRINVYIDPSISGTMYTNVMDGMNAWKNAVQVLFTQVSSAPPANSNGMTITSEYLGGVCKKATWGNSWDGGSGAYHVVKLNHDLFSQNCSGWPGLVAHEMGHAMGLAHNSYAYNGQPYPTCGGTYSMLMLGGCGIRAQTPQSADISIWNSIYHQTLGCTAYPSDPECDNQDYIQQGCNAYQQETVANGYVSVTLDYSTNCQTNWTWGKSLASQWVIVKEDVERSGTFNPGSAGPLTYTEVPSNEFSWYTNMIWAPNNQARSCLWYAQIGINRLYGPICTNWH